MKIYATKKPAPAFADAGFFYILGFLSNLVFEPPRFKHQVVPIDYVVFHELSMVRTEGYELATQLNHVFNLPFGNEEEEEIFFKLVVTKVLEPAFGHLLKLVDSPQKPVT